jgi:hypothetical protein
MTASESVTMAISAHGIWKTRLNNAIVSGKCDVDPQEARRDDSCAFGKWLKSFASTSVHRTRVAGLHTRFHATAAGVLDLALAGKKREAIASLGADSDYAKISAQLVGEMTEWKKELDRGKE